MRFLGRLLVTALATAVAVLLVPGISVGASSTGEAVLTVIGVALVFGLVNAIVRPLAAGLSFCLIIATLGLFLLVINALMLWLTSWIAQRVGLAFHVDGFVPAFLGALVISIVGGLMGGVLGKSHDRD